MMIVIRAGGVGSRLWPVSRTTKPKQFHALTSPKTMLEEAIERVDGIASAEEIFISTNANSEELVRKEYPQIPEQNIIVEPARKDTAAAIGLESVIIRKRNPEAVVASLGSDHSVKLGEEFKRVLKVAEEFVQKYPDHIMPIGIRPTEPDTGYGYIECGDVLDEKGGTKLFSVKQFREKPDLQTAREFLQQGNFLWNANMFVWKVSTVLDLFEEHMPEMYAQLQEIEAALGTPQEKEVIERVYPQMEKVAVDYAIIEKTNKIAGIPADIGWSDIGDWARLKTELDETEEANVVINADHKALKTTNSLVYTDKPGKLVATIGVENIVIVDTGDALLVCDKYHSAQVKDIVEQLKEEGRDDVL